MVGVVSPFLVILLDENPKMFDNFENYVHIYNVSCKSYLTTTMGTKIKQFQLGSSFVSLCCRIVSKR